MLFNEFNFSHEIKETLKEIGFETPTEIQNLAIPPLMESKDILASAETGSGKTAAFLIPIIEALLRKESGKTRALVLVPTRELAVQIVENFLILTKRTHLKAAAVYGGVGMTPQINAFKRNVDLIAATPGRLLDHFQHSYSKLNDLEYLVLDEADRMLDMGFLPDVKKIIKHLPSKRQTMLFSATMPGAIVELSKEMLNEPVKLNIKGKSKPASGISHYIFPVKEGLKKHLLLKLLEKPQTKSVLTFTRTRHRANKLYDFLSNNSIPCERIHGNRSQLQRMEALRGFKSGKYRVLVATDIAARGIDIEGLSTVINFDVPAATEDYIHRSGRTARAKLKGDAFTLVSPCEEYRMRMIEKHIGKKFSRQLVEGFDYSRHCEEKLEFNDQGSQRLNRKKDKINQSPESRFAGRKSFDERHNRNHQKNEKSEKIASPKSDFEGVEPKSIKKDNNYNFSFRPAKPDKKEHPSRKNYISKKKFRVNKKGSFIENSPSNQVEKKKGSPP